MIKIKFMELEVPNPETATQILNGLFLGKELDIEKSNNLDDEKIKKVVNTTLDKVPIEPLVNKKVGRKKKVDKIPVVPVDSPRGLSITDNGKLYAYFRKYAHKFNLFTYRKKSKICYSRTTVHWLDKVVEDPKNPELFLVLTDDDFKNLPAKPIAFAIASLSDKQRDYLEEYALLNSTKQNNLFHHKSGSIIVSKIGRELLNKYILLDPESKVEFKRLNKGTLIEYPVFPEEEDINEEVDKNIVNRDPNHLKTHLL